MENEEHAAAAPVSMIWRYDGQWSHVLDPIDWGERTDTEEVFAEVGFKPALSWGDSGAGIMDAWQRGEEEHWRLIVHFGSNGYDVEVLGFPHMISLISDLAPMGTAMMLASTARELDSLIILAGQDGKDALKRRYAR